MAVSLADQSGVVPTLDRAPGELVTAVAVTDPVSRTAELLGVGAFAELEASRVDRVNVPQGVSEFVHLRTWSSAAWRNVRKC